MTTLAIHRVETESQAIVLPQPRVPISIRLATLDDVPFLDKLQKQHTKMVGFFPRAWFEKNIEQGDVLIAEEINHREHREHREEGIGFGSESSPANASSVSSVPSVPSVVNRPLGYCVFKDKYLKREELGIVYQLNVLPTKQRGLIGAALVKAAFERSPWGVKLFCCWCVQDLQANHFWESLGFVPLAFRTGSRPRLKKDGTLSKPERTHIFWQRRIREGDVDTPYWFPSETSGGAVRENRLVLPIPPGTHWSDAKPAVLPGFPALPGLPGMENVNMLPAGAVEAKPRREGVKKAKANPGAVASKPRGGLWFPPPEPPPPTKEELKAAKAAAKAAKPKREKFRNDPKLVEAARELRDKYLEQANAGMLLPPGAPGSRGKYDVSRQLEAAPTKLQSDRLLDAA